MSHASKNAWNEVGSQEPILIRERLVNGFGFWGSLWSEHSLFFS